MGQRSRLVGTTLLAGLGWWGSSLPLPIQQARLWAGDPSSVPLAATVTGVSGGDRLTVRSGSSQFTVRLCGIDAPDSSQPVGKQAEAQLRKLIGQNVAVFPGRAGAKVTIAEVLPGAGQPQPSAQPTLGQTLVQAGLAYVYPSYVAECPHRQALLAAEQLARQQRLGVWGEASLPPWESRRQILLDRVLHQPDAVKRLARFKPDYLHDGLDVVQLGLASWYGPSLDGLPTASGEFFDQKALTAAHAKLPFNTRLRVTNLLNGQSVIVRINDRQPVQSGATLDLSQAAAQKLGSIQTGVVPVEIERVGDAPQE